MPYDKPNERVTAPPNVSAADQAERTYYRETKDGSSAAWIVAALIIVVGVIGIIYATMDTGEVVTVPPIENNNVAVQPQEQTTPPATTQEAPAETPAPATPPATGEQTTPPAAVEQTAPTPQTTPPAAPAN